MLREPPMAPCYRPIRTSASTTSRPKSITLAPQAQELLANLNDRVTQLKVTVDRVNDLLNDKNRKNASATLEDLHGMLAENRPQIKSTINNVNAAARRSARSSIRSRKPSIRRTRL